MWRGNFIVSPQVVEQIPSSWSKKEDTRLCVSTGISVISAVRSEIAFCQENRNV